MEECYEVRLWAPRPAHPYYASWRMGRRKLAVLRGVDVAELRGAGVPPELAEEIARAYMAKTVRLGDCPDPAMQYSLDPREERVTIRGDAGHIIDFIRLIAELRRALDSSP